MVPARDADGCIPSTSRRLNAAVYYNLEPVLGSVSTHTTYVRIMAHLHPHPAAAPAPKLRENTSKAIELLYVVRNNPAIKDWASKFQTACEILWEALEYPDLVPAHSLDVFAKSLREDRFLQLAKMVIPELREAPDPNTDNTSNTQKAQIVALAHSIAPPPIEPDPSDRALFEAERHALYDADIDRTMLFLRRAEKLSEQERKDVKAWLEACPVRPPPSAGNTM